MCYHFLNYLADLWVAVKAFRTKFDYDNEIIAYPKMNFHTKKKEHKSEFVFISLFEIGLNLILTPILQLKWHVFHLPEYGFDLHGQICKIGFWKYPMGSIQQHTEANQLCWHQLLHSLQYKQLSQLHNELSDRNSSNNGLSHLLVK